jgi:hypothetical protein
MVWAWNRLHGRRDMIVLQATLRFQPFWGLEIYRPGTVLAGDSAQLARREGWTETPLGQLRVATPAQTGTALATDLLDLVERDRVLRLAVRRQAPHLTLALNVPDPARQDPSALTETARRLAARLAP